MSTSSTQTLLDGYFAAMAAGEDFSQFYEEDVTWTMVDSGQQVRGATAVRDYVIDLHSKMQGGRQGPVVVADGHATLEGEDWNGRGLFYCLVYDVRDDRISAMRCYGTISQLMPASG